MRVHTVNRARKSKKARSCRRCGNQIQPGETYRWAEPRFGPILIWCKDHYPKRSELTSSKLGTVYDAQDDFNVDGLSLEELTSAVQSVGETAREVAEEYEGSIQNMPEALQDTSPAAEQMRETIDALEEFADECDQFEAEDAADLDEDDDEEERESKMDSVREAAQEVVSNLEV